MFTFRNAAADITFKRGQVHQICHILGTMEIDFMDLKFRSRGEPRRLSPKLFCFLIYGQKQVLSFLYSIFQYLKRIFTPEISKIKPRPHFFPISADILFRYFKEKTWCIFNTAREPFITWWLSKMQDLLQSLKLTYVVGGLGQKPDNSSYNLNNDKRYLEADFCFDVLSLGNI